MPEEGTQEEVQESATVAHPQVEAEESEATTSIQEKLRSSVEREVEKINRSHNPRGSVPGGLRDRFGTAGKPDGENPSSSSYIKELQPAPEEGLTEWVEVLPDLFAIRLSSGKLMLRYKDSALTILEGYWIRNGALTDQPCR